MLLWRTDERSPYQTFVTATNLSIIFFMPASWMELTRTRPITTVHGSTFATWQICDLFWIADEDEPIFRSCWIIHGEKVLLSDHFFPRCTAYLFSATPLNGKFGWCYCTGLTYFWENFWWAFFRCLLPYLFCFRLSCFHAHLLPCLPV